MPFTTAPAEKIQAVAEALATALRSIPDVTALSYPPDGASIAHLTVAVGEVDGRTTEPRNRDVQLGSRDWPHRWAVTGYVYLDAPEVAWPIARALVGQAITAVNADPTLGGEVEEAALAGYRVAANPPESTRRMVLAQMTFSTVYLMSNP